MTRTIRLLAVFAALMLCFTTACQNGGGDPADKYSAVKETLAQYVSLMETCAREVEAATESAGVAAALNKMNDGLQVVAPQIKILGQRYPEINDPTVIPADLKPFREKIDAVQPRIKAAMRKAESFASDPLVQLALGRYAEIRNLNE